MPWLLDTPVNTGDLAAGTYGEIKITKLKHDSNRRIIEVRLEYGNTVDGTWQRGYLPYDKVDAITISGDDYLNLVTTNRPLDANELVYQAVKRGLYEWLSTNNYIGSGTVT